MMTRDSKAYKAWLEEVGWRDNADSRRAFKDEQRLRAVMAFGLTREVDEDAEVLRRSERYEARLEAKRDRLENAAAKARREAEGRFKAEHAILDGIPMGQPILVGHHSEKRHRRDLERAHNHIRAGIEASKRAAELESRAASVGTSGISSDDPLAVRKLKEKLVALEAERDKMKAINAAYKKGRFEEVARRGLAFVSATPEAIAAANSSCEETFEKKPYAPYQLTNLGARIRDVKARIEALQRENAKPEAEPIEVNGARVEEDKEINRILLRFPGKPPAATIDNLKGEGWHWNRTEVAWSRQLNDSARWSAKRILGINQAGST